jgi:hypothetical protein
MSDKLSDNIQDSIDKITSSGGSLFNKISTLVLDHKYILAVVMVILLGGYYWFYKRKPTNVDKYDENPYSMMEQSYFNQHNNYNQQQNIPQQQIPQQQIPYQQTTYQQQQTTYQPQQQQNIMQNDESFRNSDLIQNTEGRYNEQLPPNNQEHNFTNPPQQ